MKTCHLAILIRLQGLLQDKSIMVEPPTPAHTHPCTLILNLTHCCWPPKYDQPHDALHHQSHNDLQVQHGAESPNTLCAAHLTSCCRRDCCTQQYTQSPWGTRSQTSSKQWRQAAQCATPEDKHKSASKWCIITYSAKRIYLPPI